MNLLALAACSGNGSGSGGSWSNAGGSSQFISPGDPVLNGISFRVSGVINNLSAPFSGTVSINADTGGVCSASQSSIVFTGTFDNILTASLILNGAASFGVVTSGNTFTISSCVSNGVSGLTIAARSIIGTQDSFPASVSIQLNSNYFMPVRRMATSGVSAPVSGGVMAEQISIGAKQGALVSSTGNLGFSLVSGFSGIMSNENP